MIDSFKKVHDIVRAQKELVESDPHRLSFHIMPETGLLNDPNGLLYFKGKYHVFYQWNPFETTHGAKFWGHVTSTDLVNWHQEEIALAPDEWYETHGCYSGSAVEHDGKMYLIYTGNVKDAEGNRETYQCLAESEDGITFKKHGPVVHLPEGYTAHFRDPKVWKEKDTWYMVVGAQTPDETGVAALLSSPDLFDWKLEGTVAGSHLNGLEEFGYMWECPDMFTLNGRDVMMLSPQGIEPEGFKYHNLFQTGYFIGKLDYDQANFSHGEFKELDHGFDFYAPQTFEDPKGRRLLFAWMGMTDSVEEFQPTIQKGWIHALTIPRELVLKGETVYQIVPEELEQLRQAELLSMEGEVNESIVIEKPVVEIDLKQLELQGDFTIAFRDNATFTYDVTNKVATLGRKGFKDGEMEYRSCELESLQDLRIFVDSSSIEMFINEGETSFTTRYYPNEKNDTITLSSPKSFNGSVNVYDLQKAKSN